MALIDRIGRDGPKRLLGCPKIEPEAVQKLDAIPDLLAVRQAVAEKRVQASHFAKFPPAART